MKEYKSFTLLSEELEGQCPMKHVFKNEELHGENISPQLSWVNAPEGTESFAITVYDPDAPTGCGWWHWIIFDIPAEVNSLDSDAGNLRKKVAPAMSIQSLNDYLTHGYGGPCPPKGDKPHRYIFTIHALNTRSIGLNKDANPALVGFVLNQYTIAKASLITYFGRK
ncbi:MAG: YbhB/YbcL family Raf kinase inhibitor-like protein [Bacteroidales bacterium]